MIKQGLYNYLVEVKAHQEQYVAFAFRSLSTSQKHMCLSSLLFDFMSVLAQMTQWLYIQFHHRIIHTVTNFGFSRLEAVLNQIFMHQFFYKKKYHNCFRHLEFNNNKMYRMLRKSTGPDCT